MENYDYDYEIGTLQSFDPFIFWAFIFPMIIGFIAICFLIKVYHDWE